MNKNPKEIKKPVTVQQPVRKQRAGSVDQRKSSFIINKKSSIKNSRISTSMFDHLLFNDVPLGVKQVYLKQLEQQITELNSLKEHLELNINRQESQKISQISEQQKQFTQEIDNIKHELPANSKVLQQLILLSQVLQCQNEFQQLDQDIIDNSYLKDLEQFKWEQQQQEQILQSSNKFVPYENEFL